MQRDDLDRGNTKKKKRKKRKMKPRRPKECHKLGETGKEVIGAGKNSCAGPEITRELLLVSKILPLQRGWKTFKSGVYDNQHRGARFFSFLNVPS